MIDHLTDSILQDKLDEYKIYSNQISDIVIPLLVLYLFSYYNKRL